jgi:signal transduction histidine kinase
MRGVPIEVLIVDDTAANLVALDAVLAPLDVEIVRATSGAQALELVRAHGFAVMVLDVMMPGMDGFETARRVRALERGRLLPIILLTAYEFGLPQIRAAYASGVVDFLFKPFDPDILRAKVSVFVDLLRKIRIERERDEAHAREHELRRLDGLKDEFLATLAHELRNPLASLLSATEILDEREPRDEHERARFHGMIRRQVAHLCVLVEDSLEISRFTQGKIRVRPQPLDLREIVDRAVELSQAAIQAHGVVLSVSLPPEAVRINGDRVRLAQVISNLLDNAAKFTPAGGQVWITLESSEQRGVLRVRDSGCGIAPSQLARIFQPFVQSDPGDGTRGGLGIGLALVRRLVELHGGSVEASSAGAGQGTELVVSLPLDRSEIAPRAGTLSRDHEKGAPAAFASEPGHAREPSPSSSSSSSSSAPVGGAHWRVLVVDDNPEIRSTLQVFLRLEGHEVDTADCGVAAVERIRETDPDVVLLDIGLPDLDGYAVAEQVRAIRRARAPRLIAMTGVVGPREKARALRSGFDAHLSKPVDGRTLLRTIGAPPS